MSEHGTYALRFLGGGDQGQAASILRERFQISHSETRHVLNQQQVFVAGLDHATATEIVDRFARETRCRVAMLEEAEYHYAFDPGHPRRGDQPLLRLRRHGTTLAWERGRMGEWTRDRELGFESADACEQAIADACASFGAQGLEPADSELDIVRRLSAREPGLEQVIREVDEPDEAMAVHADWLERQGDPRGLVAALDLARARAESPEQRAPLDQAFAEALIEHRAHLFGPLHAALDPARLTWRGGFVIDLEIDRLEVPHPDRPRLLDDLQLVDNLLALPICACLRSLSVGVPSGLGLGNSATLRCSGTQLIHSDPVALAGLRERVLRSHVPFDALDWSRMPGLERLTLVVADRMTPMDLPRLRHLDLGFWAARTTLPPLCESCLPNLRSLALWFDASDYGPKDWIALAELLTAPFVRSLDTLALLADEGPCGAELVQLLIDADGLERVGRVDLRGVEFEPSARALLLAARERLPNFMIE